MIYIALFLSVTFFSLGFIVNKKNAKYVLSGYNTMSEAERANVDIDSYLRYFKRFHIVMGLSLFLGTLLISWINNNWASIFMTTFPLVAYSIMAFRGTSYTKAFQGRRLTSYVIGGILLIIAAFIGLQEINDLQSSDLIFNKDTIEIKGSYGMTIRKQDILDVRSVKLLPPTSFKQNGFAAGDYAKGTFKAKNGSIVRMFVNRSKDQFLLLNTTHGDIYYNSDEIGVDELEKRVLQWQGIN